MKKFNGFLPLGFLVGGLLVTLPGCTLWENVKDKLSPQTKSSTSSSSSTGASGDAILLHINGKPALTEEEFDKYLMQVLQSNPYFKSMGKDALPLEVKKKVFDRIIEQRLIVEQAKKQGLDKGEEFKKSFDETIKLVESSLLVQFYEKDILDNISVSDKEIEEEFEKNKSRYVKVAGGSLVEGVKFGSEKDAERFLDRVKGDSEKFVEFAQNEKGGLFKEFGRVSNDPRSMMGSEIPNQIRKASLGLKKLPGTLLVKDAEDNNALWVIRVSDKKDTVLFGLAEIRQQLEMMIKMTKSKQVHEDKMKELRNQFTIDIKDDFLKPAAGSLQAQAQPQDGVVRLSADQLPIRKIQNAQNAEQPNDSSSAAVAA